MCAVVAVRELTIASTGRRTRACLFFRPCLIRVNRRTEQAYRWPSSHRGTGTGTAEKIYSIFEPHTDLIKRGKVQTPIEFGHKVFLAESPAA